MRRIRHPLLTGTIGQDIQFFQNGLPKDDLIAQDGWVYGIVATGHRVQPLSNNRCRVSFEIPLFAAPYTLICKLALQRIAKMATEAAQE